MALLAMMNKLLMGYWSIISVLAILLKRIGKDFHVLSRMTDQRDLRAWKAVARVRKQQPLGKPEP